MNASPRSSTTVSEFLAEWADRRLHVTSRHRVATESFSLSIASGSFCPKIATTLSPAVARTGTSAGGALPTPNDPQNSGISLPWIDKDYFDSGIVILGINFDNFGGLAGHYYICEATSGRWKPAMRGKAAGRSRGARMQYLRIVLASLNGDDLPADSANVTNQELAGPGRTAPIYRGSKCAPGADKSKPTEAMIWNCPPFLASPNSKSSSHGLSCISAEPTFAASGSFKRAATEKRKATTWSATRQLSEIEPSS